LFARDTFLFIALLGYFLGSLPTEKVCRHICHSSFPLLWEFPGDKKYFSSFFANLLKGAFAVLLARVLIGTAMAQALAGIAVLCGHYWSCFTRFRGGTGIGVLFGILLVFAPEVLPYLIAIWLISYLSFSSVMPSSILTMLALPVSLWQVKGFDLYIVFGIFSALLVGYHLLGENGYRKRMVRQAAFVLLISSLLTTGFFTNYVYRGFGIQLDMIRQGNPELPFVAITFDDGPDPAYTPAILDILAAHNVKATFFMVGRHVRQYPDIARRIVAEGHDIGNHTYTHRSMVPLSPDKILEEIVYGEKIIEEVTGKKVYFFRPPRGLYNQVVRDIVADRQYTMVLWSISSQDWRESSSRIITQKILDSVIGGDILLFHDSGNLITAQGGNRYNTVAALPKILAGLEEKGLVPVTMQEMLLIKGLTHVEDGD
jgi:peptidoglycan/xylan/chitin deacetylase (PgdA/CDA1 family)